MKKQYNIGYIMILIFLGIIIGMILSWIFIFISIYTFTNNILPKIQIENVNFDINETELVNQLNQTFYIRSYYEEKYNSTLINYTQPLK